MSPDRGYTSLLLWQRHRRAQAACFLLPLKCSPPPPPPPPPSYLVLSGTICSFTCLLYSNERNPKKKTKIVFRWWDDSDDLYLVSIKSGHRSTKNKNTDPLKKTQINVRSTWDATQSQLSNTCVNEEKLNLVLANLPKDQYHHLSTEFCHYIIYRHYTTQS